jgi:hypothetical protein
LGCPPLHKMTYGSFGGFLRVGKHTKGGVMSLNEPMVETYWSREGRVIHSTSFSPGRQKKNPDEKKKKKIVRAKKPQKVLEMCGDFVPFASIPAKGAICQKSPHLPVISAYR